MKTYMPNGDVIETRPDGGGPGAYFYEVLKNGAHAGMLTIHPDSGTVTAVDNNRRLHLTTSSSQAAIEHLTA